MPRNELPADLTATAGPRTVPLHRLKRGQSGHVERLSLPPTQAARLAGLGLCEGRLIEVISTGDPTIVRACGSTLAVGKALAEGVELCVCHTSTCPHEAQSPSPQRLRTDPRYAAAGKDGEA